MAQANNLQQALPPLKGKQLVFGTISLSLATFMNVLDSSIANVSLPTIAGDLGVSSSQVIWVITSFAVANAISIPLTGWLTQRFGAVRLFTVSVLLFVIASLLCGFAPSIQMLIFFRLIQGAVAGPMIPLSQSLLLSSYPKAKAGTALAMWSLTTLIAPVAGPLLGGYITDNISWPWIFYINVPIGIAAAWITWSIYRNRETPTRKLPIDGVGLGLLVIWVGAMQVTLDKGKELDWFSSPLIVSLALIALIGFIVFIVWELTDEHPVVDLRLFAGRNFWTGVVAISLGYGIFFGNVVLLPLWLQEYMGFTATWAGLVTAPVGFLAILFSPIVGKNIQKVDPRKLSTIAFLVFALVFWMRSHYTIQTNLYYLLIPTIIQGIAMAFFFIPLVSLTLSGLPPQSIPAASGLSNFVRITAGAFGTSIATTMWETRAALHHAHLSESINPYNSVISPILNRLGDANLSQQQSLLQINRLIDQQAFTQSADDIFFMSSIICLFLIAILWIARPIKASASVDASSAH